MTSGRIEAIEDRALGNTSYLIDVGRGAGVVVDAPRDVERHLAAAEARHLQIVASLDTHLHADFVGGAREIADAVGAEVVGPADGGAAHLDRGVGEGDKVRWGDMVATVLATPGHTPEHVAYAFDDSEGAPIVFTGGSVIGGGAARTDLLTPEDTEPLARAQFRSFRRLAALPDAAELRPTHGAGSFCSTGAKPSGVMTLGSERRTNALLALEDEEEFVRYLLSGYGSFPPYFLRLRDVNRSGVPLLRELPAVPVLEVDAAREAVQAGAWLVDARAAVQWSAAHPEGAVSISLDGSFATWLGWVIPFGEPIVFIIDAARLDDAVRQARRIGYDRLVGFLAPDPEAWRQAGWNVLSAPVYEPGEAAELSGDGWRLLDVRQDSEVAGGRIPGAMHIELGDIVGGSVPEGPVITYCGHGERSATAASLLERRGIEAASLRGGIGSWKDAKLPVQ